MDIAAIPMATAPTARVMNVPMETIVTGMIVMMVQAMDSGMGDGLIGEGGGGRPNHLTPTETGGKLLI
jgi:hypothetical protein